MSCWAGGAGTEVICSGEVRRDDEAEVFEDDDEEEAAAAAAACDGEEMGAFIASLQCSIKRLRKEEAGGWNSKSSVNVGCLFCDGKKPVSNSGPPKELWSVSKEKKKPTRVRRERSRRCDGGKV